MEKNRLKKYFIIFSSIFVFLIVFIALFDDDTSEEAKADGFKIYSYNVILDVKEDNKVDVTEEITVDWLDTKHHGIYKFTPQWLEYTGKDGKTIKRKSKVKDLRAEGDQYTTDTVKKKARIKIGSSSKYVEKGLKTYTIKYTYDMGKDPFKGFDEFIFHAFGDYWGTEIKNATIEVHMPKNIEDENYNINFFTDKKRNDNVNEYVKTYSLENVLYAKFDGEKYKKDTGKDLTKSLTVDIELPEGYFNGGSWNYGIFSFLCCAVILFFTILLFALWKKYGKDHKKREQTVEFYPPDNLSSSEIGFAYNNYQTSNKLTVSLIISLASKGYIKINELDKDKIQIINSLGQIPEKPKTVADMVEKREIDISKLKDKDDKLSNEGKTMMDYLFKKGPNKKVKTNINSFLRVKNELVEGNYIKINSDNEEERLKGMDEKQKIYDEAMKEYNIKMEEYEKSIENYPELNEYERIVYEKLFDKKNDIILKEHKTFYKAFESVNDKLNNEFQKKIDDLDSRVFKYLGVVLSIVSFILFILAYRTFEDLDPAIGGLYKISFIACFVSIFFTIFMPRKTKYGEELIAKIKGFRSFLETAEKEQLEDLVEKNPEYFYNILPYTYVLGISKKWIKKFEKIPMPESDMGSFDITNTSRWDAFYSNVYVPTPTYSSSGSSCGGGCSSCGGGCSSCGGGGSW